MSDLMVHREAIFHGVEIRAVLDSGPGKPLYIALRARDAEWFSPEEPGADADGFVRRFDPGSVQGELELRFADPDRHARAVEQLQAWQESPPPRLTGISSLRFQYVGIIDRDAKLGVGVKMSPAAQDRP